MLAGFALLTAGATALAARALARGMACPFDVRFAAASLAAPYLRIEVGIAARPERRDLVVVTLRPSREREAGPTATDDADTTVIDRVGHQLGFTEPTR